MVGVVVEVGVEVEVGVGVVVEVGVGAEVTSLIFVVTKKCTEVQKCLLKKRKRK